LTNSGIDSVYVISPYFDDEPPEILHEKTRVEVIKITQKVFTDFSRSKSVNFTGLSHAAKMIVQDVIHNKNALIQLTDIRTHDDYTFGHSINTCLIAIMIGLKMHLNAGKLDELALGVILHDIGKMLISPGVLNKEGVLSAEEWQTLKEHSQAGFDILRKQEDIPLTAASVAYQHHENYDGTGYPRGIAAEEIHSYARIAAVADIYDALTSDRSYRPAMLPHEAYEVVLSSRGMKLDPLITDVFLENVALYPIGTMVRLDTGEIGVVSNVYPKLTARPIIRLVFDESGNNITENDKFRDLSQELTRFITKVFKPEEILTFPR
jgi:HD-GYP domain-containing protein (c-di-GMP phosphodiesterase class II)